MNLPAIIALWYERGTIYDAAAAANKTRAHVKWVSPAWVREKWAQAQKDGRLPPIDRPADGVFAEYQKPLIDIWRGRDAA